MTKGRLSLSKKRNLGLYLLIIGTETKAPDPSSHWIHDNEHTELRYCHFSPQLLSFGKVKKKKADLDIWCLIEYTVLRTQAKFLEEWKTKTCKPSAYKKLGSQGPAMCTFSCVGSTLQGNPAENRGGHQICMLRSPMHSLQLCWQVTCCHRGTFLTEAWSRSGKYDQLFLL